MVLIVALLVLGPNRLPEAARSMGKAMAEFRKVTGGLQAEMRDAMSQLENEVNQTEPPGPPAIPSPTPPTAPPPALPPEPPASSSGEEIA